MLYFKSFHSAHSVLAGIELMHMIPPPQHLAYGKLMRYYLVPH